MSKLSPNQIRANARAFSKLWANESREEAEAKTFWDEFFRVFGVSRREVAVFESGVKRHSSTKFIDVFWPGMLICEHKSRGKSLEAAESQAMGYLRDVQRELPKAQLPRYVMVCDFARLHLIDLESSQSQTSRLEINLAELGEHIEAFGFLSGYVTSLRAVEEAANITAAEKMGKLHDQLESNGYAGHELRVMLIRLLFCLFAEDTGIFEQSQFQNLIQQRSREDGSDLAGWIQQLFETLNRAPQKRLKNLDEQLAQFAYINGDVFAETLPMAAFDSTMRMLLLDACALDWGQISPEIFGALFQSVMNKAERRGLGAHYTSEANILKVINSLFLHDLRAELEQLKMRGKGKARQAALDAFHQKLASLTFLDPACGCGNFLVVAYRELRLLELEVIEALHKKGQILDVGTIIRCNVQQFYGLEIEEFPSQIARVALWLTDHQCNMLVSRHFGTHYARIPLTQSADIRNQNALQHPWPVTDFILGNPPFLGKTYQNEAQKADMATVCHNIKNAGNLDFVAAWYVKATAQMVQYPNTRTAFVSTNSITQGEQVPILWSWLLKQGMNIHFAHRTFQWQSAARGKAAVHCIVVGFGKTNYPSKLLFDYPDIKSEPIPQAVTQINPYLVAAAEIIIDKRSQPICNVPEMNYGSKPVDNGNLLFSDTEKQAFLEKEPQAKNYIRRFLGSEELINNKTRWCLWLVDCPPQELRKMPLVLKRIEAVRQFRLASTKAPTRQQADTPSIFTEIRQPKSRYLAIPEVSSENRFFVPIDYLESDIIASNLIYTIQNATLYHFGIMSSIMHNAWMRAVCGRLESRYRYSAGIVYNNFPWPDATAKQQETIAQAAQAVLNARADFPTSSLADLYDPNAMPAALVKAHKALDKAVDAAYGKTSFGKDTEEAERVAFLFSRYQAITSLLPAEAAKPKRKAAKKA